MLVVRAGLRWCRRFRLRGCCLDWVVLGMVGAVNRRCRLCLRLLVVVGVRGVLTELVVGSRRRCIFVGFAGVVVVSWLRPTDAGNRRPMPTT